MPESTLPAALLPLRDTLNRLLWASKKQLRRLAHNLADLLTREFMREFDRHFAQDADSHRATQSAYGRIGYLASHLNCGVPGWRAWRENTLTGERALQAAARLQSSPWWLNRL